MVKSKAKGQAPVVDGDDWMKWATPAQLMLTGALVAACNPGGATPVYDHSLVDHLIAQIQPRPEFEAGCREKIEKDINLIKNIRETFDVYSPGETKAKLEQFRSSLKKVRNLAAGLGPAVHALIFGGPTYDDTDEEDEIGAHPEYKQFDRQLYCMVRNIDFSISEIRGKKGAKRRSLSKAAAAGSAFMIMKKYSAFQPTSTKEGRFLTAASLLWEAASGEVADLRCYCRVDF
jgi:hypothetical protein